MDLKFEFKKVSSSSAIVRVSVDENGNIQGLSSSDFELEKKLLEEDGSSEFKKFVKCIFSGSICSDQIDVIHKGKTMTYKVEQFPGFENFFERLECFRSNFFIHKYQLA